jgi:DNA polymerase-3 subunit alpha
MNELKEWLDARGLVYNFVDKILNISSFGRLLYIEGIDGKLIGENFEFLLTDEEDDLLYQDDDLNHVVFKWGTKFYYSTLEEKRDEQGDVVYEPVFNDLVNLGEYQSKFESIGFVNLGVHTGYELLNGSGEASKWVNKAKFMKHSAVGICEKNTLAGTLPLQMACKKAGLRCVHGITISVATEYDPSSENQNLFDLKLYVKDEVGWRNLLNISKLINVDFAGYIPEEMLLERTEGLVCVFPTEGYFNRLISEKAKALKYINKYKKFFGEDLFYQIDCSEYDDDGYDLRILKNIKTYFNDFSKFLKPVLISDSYYVEKFDYKVKEYLNKVDRKAHAYSTEQYYKDVDDIFNKIVPHFEKNSDLFNLILRGAKNTKLISDICLYQIDTGNHKLPKFEVDDPEKLYDELIEIGFRKKVLSKFTDESKIVEYLERVDEENSVIKGAGFIHYFLILWDIIEWAKSQDILVGPARGSAGGSLVAYLLGITEIDPIQYKLLFERFLNKARVSGERAKSADALPDIDVDFEGARRQDVKRYIEEKYGFDYVCSIGTYTRLKPKSAIKDFSRVKGLTFQEVNDATRDLDDSYDPDWKEIFSFAVVKSSLKSFVQNNVDICEVIKAPMGQPRSGSIHPSAVLIVPKYDSNGKPMKIHDWMPVKLMDGQLVSEWEGKYIDAAGFLKEDILGIQQLDKFKYILSEIRKNKQKKVSLNKIPIDKPEVMKYFKRGWNEDVFQFGTSGLKNYSKKVRPDGIEDLISMNALFRPGPMDSKAHEKFVEIKHGKLEPVYDYKLEVVTENTFGLYIYQEQIMQAVNVLGKLTLAEADELRTAIKKFDHAKMNSAKEKFLSGAIENGCPRVEAEAIWDKLNAFSAYGFNRSHSAAYSLMGYWCQYLKVMYPLEFWTASLNFADEKVEIPNRLSEIEKIGSGINVRQPDVNKSDIQFTADVSSNSIYWSLTKIKNVGQVAVQNILEERVARGQFFDLEDFIKRVPKSKVNKRVIQALIIAGAFDEIGGDGGSPISEVKQRMYILKKHCSITGCDYIDGFPNTDAENSNWFWSIKQRDLTGFGFVDFLPMIRKKENKLKKYPYVTAKDFETMDFREGKPWKPELNGKPITIAGSIHGIKVYRTKANGNYRVVITVESNNVLIFIGVFGDLWETISDDFENLSEKKLLFAVNGYALSNKHQKSKHAKGSGNNHLWLTKQSRLIVLNDK